MNSYTAFYGSKSHILQARNSSLARLAAYDYFKKYYSDCNMLNIDIVSNR